MEILSTYTAFEGSKLIFRGTLSEVILKIKKRIGNSEDTEILIFSDSTGQTMDFNFQGSEKDVLKRLEIYVTESTPKENVGPGRPKLGVVPREVSLLPRHWEWLATQPGGASASLRKLVDEAKKKSSGGLSIKQLQERAHKFMSAIAGDMEGYEEALRFLYRKDKKNFLLSLQKWPLDVKEYALELTKGIFEGE